MEYELAAQGCTSLYTISPKSPGKACIQQYRSLSLYLVRGRDGDIHAVHISHSSKVVNLVSGDVKRNHTRTFMCKGVTAVLHYFTAVLVPITKRAQLAV